MLKTKFEKNNVVTLKLVSGEEVIGYYVSEDDNNVYLRKPVVPVPTGDQHMGLAPFVMSSDYLNKDVNGEVPFNRVTVITALTTGKQFRDAYVYQISGLDFTPGQNNNPGFITS